jgi:hypothetical protein
MRSLPDVVPHQMRGGSAPWPRPSEASSDGETMVGWGAVSIMVAWRDFLGSFFLPFFEVYRDGESGCKRRAENVNVDDGCLNGWTQSADEWPAGWIRSAIGSGGVRKPDSAPLISIPSCTPSLKNTFPLAISLSFTYTSSAGVAAPAVFRTAHVEASSGGKEAVRRRCAATTKILMMTMTMERLQRLRKREMFKGIGMSLLVS